jgi:tetratricopeptide (TPR) repeat protein
MPDPFYDRAIEFEFQEGKEGDGGFVASGKLVVAVRDHLRDGEVEAAVKLYQSSSHDLGDELMSELRMESTSLVRSMARMFVEARDFKRAASCYEQLGDGAKAAKLYEQAARFADAARMYSAAKEPGLAAQMYLRAGQPGAAARLYEEAGNHGNAAEAYELAQDYVSAGRAYAKAGLEARAVPSLQKVDVDSTAYAEARLLLGTILARSGKLDLAARAFAEAILRSPLPAQYGAEISYRLGHVYARMGDNARARVAYERVQAISPNYRDVAERLTALGASPAPEAVADARPLRSAPAMTPKAPPASVAPPPESGGGAVEAGNVVTLLEGFEYLKALPLARDLSLDDLRLLYAQCELCEFSDGAELIHEGKPGEGLFILREGRLSVLVGGKSVAELEPGAYVGEMSMVDDGPTSATVVAKTAVKAFKLSKEKFQHLLKTNAGVALSVYRVFVETVVGRLRSANEQLRRKA